MRFDQSVAYVESLLERLTGADKVAPDHDGDYPIGYRDTRYYVRVVDHARPVVQIFAVALADVAPSAELHGALNDLNADLRFARAFHVAGQVLIEADILAEALDPSGFFNACELVGAVSTDVGPRLQQRFGGELFTISPQGRGGPEEPTPATGMYL